MGACGAYSLAPQFGVRPDRNRVGFAAECEAGMSQKSAQPDVSIAAGRLMAVVVGAWAASGVLASGVALAMGQRGAWIGAVATLVGVGLGLMFVAVSGPRPAGLWAMVQVVASMARMLLGLGVAVGLYLAAGPDKYGYWGVVLATLLATLVAEVAVFLPVVRGGARAGTEAAA